MLTKRKVIATLVLVGFLGFIWPHVALAFKNEPSGYFGHKWGTPMEDISFRTEFVDSMKDVKVDIYTRLPKGRTLDTSILALDGKMVGVVIQPYNIDEADVMGLASILIDSYGSPTNYDKAKGLLMWAGKVSVIQFDIYKAMLIVGDPNGLLSIASLLQWYKSRKGS